MGPKHLRMKCLREHSFLHAMNNNINVLFALKFSLQKIDVLLSIKWTSRLIELCARKPRAFYYHFIPDSKIIFITYVTLINWWKGKAQQKSTTHSELTRSDESDTLLTMDWLINATTLPLSVAGVTDFVKHLFYHNLDSSKQCIDFVSFGTLYLLQYD